MSTGDKVSLHARVLINDGLIDDKPIDDVPIDDSLTVLNLEETFTRRWTTTELKERFDIDFARTPHNERIIFFGARYVGIVKVRNEKYNCNYEMHVWLVYFDRANHTDFEKPVKGLLMIRAKHWRNAGYPEPSTVFQGRCTIIADNKRQILSIEGNRDKL